MEEKAYDFHDLIDEYIEKDLYAFQKLYLEHIKIKNITDHGGTDPGTLLQDQSTETSADHDFR